MKEMKTKHNEERALRIMEALSGVDEELLERCQGAGVERAADPGVETASDRTAGPSVGTVINRFVWRHGRACAACLCLVILGAVFWGMERQVLKPYGSKDMSADSAAEYDMSIAGGVEPATGMPAGDAEEAGAEGTESAVEMQPSLPGEEKILADVAEAMEPQWIDMQRYMKTEAEKHSETTDYRDSSAMPEIIQKESLEAERQEASSGTENGVMESKEEISWEQACSLEDVGAYIPDRIPAGYESISVRCNNAGEERNRVTLLWNNGEKNLWLNITETDWPADIRIDSEPPVFTVEEDWKNLLPKPDEDGGIQFGLLFEDGVLVEYQGCLTEDEVFELFDSIR